MNVLLAPFARLHGFLASQTPGQGTEQCHGQSRSLPELEGWLQPSPQHSFQPQHGSLGDRQGKPFQCPFLVTQGH